MIKENLEKRLEKEISILEESLIDAEINNISKEEINVEINIDGQKINETLDMDISFLLVVGPNFPYRAPKLFCTTLFCLPSIADGRDLLEDVLNSPWITSTRLIDIIQKIPDFLYTFITHLQEGMLVLVGNYYLGERYEMSMFENLPVFFHKITERVNIGKKIVEYDDRMIMISDLFICVFELDRWTLKSNNLTLLFYANIRSIISLKKIAEENLVRFVFKDKYKKQNYELVFTIENTNDEFISKLLKIMSTLGIKYNVKKTNQKTGELPNLDVEAVENDIVELEKKIERENKKEDIETLMELYKKVIEFYSANNNTKYEYYLGKLHEMIGSPRFKVLMSGMIYNQQIIKEEVKGEEDDKSQIEENHPKVKVENSVKYSNDEREFQNNLLKNSVSKEKHEAFNQNENTNKLEKSRVKQNNQESNLDGIVIDNEDNLPNFDEGNESADSD